MVVGVSVGVAVGGPVGEGVGVGVEVNIEVGIAVFAGASTIIEIASVAPNIFPSGSAMRQ